MSDPTRYLNKTQLAQLLGLTKRGVEELMHARKIAAPLTSRKTLWI